MKIQGLLLLGGRGSRMRTGDSSGEEKWKLKIGGVTFLEIIAFELMKEAESIFLSCRDSKQEKAIMNSGIIAPELCAGKISGVNIYHNHIKIIHDEFPGIGPLGGLQAGLKEMDADYLFVAPCDMPFLEIGLYKYLLKNISRNISRDISSNISNSFGNDLDAFDGVVPVYHGRVYPLCAVYRPSLLPFVENAIRMGQYRIRSAIKEANILYQDISENARAGEILRNINTEEEYKDLLMERKLIAVSGLKNSGKTTLLVSLVRELRGRGLNVAVIKHDGHSFECDIPGTDSYRLTEAGAFASAVFSKGHLFINRYDPEENTAGNEEINELENEKIDKNNNNNSNSNNNNNNVERILKLSHFFPEADVIFVEGMKESGLPKIEVWWKKISERPVSNPEGLFLIVTRDDYFDNDNDNNDDYNNYSDSDNDNVNCPNSIPTGEGGDIAYMKNDYVGAGKGTVDTEGQLAGDMGYTEPPGNVRDVQVLPFNETSKIADLVIGRIRNCN